MAYQCGPWYTMEYPGIPWSISIATQNIWWRAVYVAPDLRRAGFVVLELVHCIRIEIMCIFAGVFAPIALILGKCVLGYEAIF